MATTTNYGWTTPNDTDLVKDGAAAIRTLGSSVDTTTKALNPSTTLGDIEYRSSTANTNTRLGIGSSSQVLTVVGGVPAWATAAAGGGLVGLASGSLSGASVTLSSISGSYKDLKLVVRNFVPATGSSLRIRLNGDSGGNYRDFDYTQSGFRFTYSETSFLTQNDNSGTSGTSSYNITFYDYANTVTRKLNLMEAVTTGTDFTLGGRTGSWNNSAAITSIEMRTSAASMTGTYILYGVQ